MSFNINLTISLAFLEEEIEIVDNHSAEERKRAGAGSARGGEGGGGDGNQAADSLKFEILERVIWKREEVVELLESK